MGPDAHTASLFPGEPLIADRTGIAAAVVDANDLAAAKVLGSSRGVRSENVVAALLDNPHGNSDEQTPVVVFKWRGDGPNPLLQGDAG